MAAGTSAAIVRARSTCRPSSGLARLRRSVSSSSTPSRAGCQTLRDRLWSGLSARVDRIHVNGALQPRLANNLNIRVDGVHGETLLKAIASDVAVSSGAACATASAEPSHVLRAIGLADEEARASIRFGLHRFNTEAEIDHAAGVVGDAVRHLRGQC